MHSVNALAIAATDSRGISLSNTGCPRCGGLLPLLGIFPRGAHLLQVPVHHHQAVCHSCWCSANPISSIRLLCGSRGATRAPATGSRVWLTLAVEYWHLCSSPAVSGIPQIPSVDGHHQGWRHAAAVLYQWQKPSGSCRSQCTVVVLLCLAFLEFPLLVLCC